MTVHFPVLFKLWQTTFRPEEEKDEGKTDDTEGNKDTDVIDGDKKDNGTDVIDGDKKDNGTEYDGIDPEEGAIKDDKKPSWSPLLVTSLVMIVLPFVMLFFQWGLPSAIEYCYGDIVLVKQLITKILLKISTIITKTTKVTKITKNFN